WQRQGLFAAPGLAAGFPRRELSCHQLKRGNAPAEQDRAASTADLVWSRRAGTPPPEPSMKPRSVRRTSGRITQIFAKYFSAEPGGNRYFADLRNNAACRHENSPGTAGSRSRPRAREAQSLAAVVRENAATARETVCGGRDYRNRHPPDDEP